MRKNKAMHLFLRKRAKTSLLSEEPYGQPKRRLSKSGCPLISSKKVVSTLIVYTLMVCCPAAGALTLTTLGPARTSCPGVAGDPAAAMVVMPGEAILMMVGAV